MKREPQAEQTVGALLDRANDRARALARVIADRQRDRLIERDGHRDQAAAVGQPIGGKGNDHAREDAEQAEGSPQADERERARPCRQRIDDAPEQDRLGEQDDADDDVGDDEAAGEPPLRGEEAERAPVGRGDADAGGPGGWLAARFGNCLGGCGHDDARDFRGRRRGLARRSCHVSQANTPGMNHGVPL